ncbi:MAG: helix-turn-helix transcriptional regulator [Clostridia bacterium]|nr:helix-turn-helix transcriptional regulator [Clostridia bacterium]
MPYQDTPLTEAFYYILLAVRRPNHGYGITQEVDTLTHGRVVLGAGTLYGALQTLEKRGWICVYSADEASRKKKEYVITRAGREAFRKEHERLAEMLRDGQMMGADEYGTV